MAFEQLMAEAAVKKSKEEKKEEKKAEKKADKKTKEEPTPAAATA